jgi:tetratricopeptide (TPR) repeat protein
MAERFLYLPSVAFALAAAALAYRFVPPRTAAMVLGALVLLCAGRTFARNADWDNDLTLTSHDVAVVPDSFRIRAMYGEFLLQADRANIDRAIPQEEAAWAILQTVPPAWGYPQIPSSLGRLYGVKGDMLGPSSPEGAAWYGKALAMSQRAMAIADASQKDFDDAQLRAGKPLPARLPYQNVYYFAALGFRSTRRFAEAIDAYRRAQAVQPANAEYYTGIADSYAGLGDSARAAVTVLEKDLAFGLAPEGAVQISQADVCQALSSLTATYTAARDLERAAAFRARRTQAGCSAAH